MASENSKQFRYDGDNRIHRFLRTALISVVSISMLVMVWWVVSVAVGSPAIPAPPAVWEAFINLMNHGDRILGYTMMDHASISLRRFLFGFAIAFAVAVPLGLLIGYSKILDEFTKPVLELLRPIAPIAWAPILLFITNPTWAPILVVFVGIVFPLLTNTIFGVKKIDRNLIDAARTLGANKMQTFYKVMFPCTVPYIMSGIKIGLGIGWMCIIAAELYTQLDGGIGTFILMHTDMGNWANGFVGIIFISIMGLLTVGLAEYAHRAMVKRMGME
ncbi:MAG: ABC transporter permease [Methanomassiliicoccaceae archaeon]|nr:ABC transporter permease [Methanomassiliicoccaceae archaeon]